MKLIWTKKGITLNKVFGTTVRGMIKDNERPDLIAFTASELLEIARELPDNRKYTSADVTFANQNYFIQLAHSLRK